MKKWMITLAMALILAFGGSWLLSGCENLKTSQGRLETAEAVLVQAQEVSGQYADEIQMFQEITEGLKAKLSQEGLPAEEQSQIKQQISQVAEVMAKVLAQKQQIDEGIAQLYAAAQSASEGGDADLSDELTFLSGALQTGGTFLPMPWGKVLTGAGWLLGIVASFMASKKGRTLREVVNSVTTVLNSKAVPDREQVISMLRAGQSPSTQQAVKKIKAA